MLKSPRRFLVIRLSSIGDIVHALPAVAALGEARPHAEIHWVVESRHAALVEGNPYVHRAVKLDTLGWRERSRPAEMLEEIARDVMTLRKASFNAAIDFQGLWKSGLIAWLSRSEARVGFAENWLREPAAAVFYTERVSPRACRHVIEMNLALVERLGARAPERAAWKFPLPRTEADDGYVDQQVAALERREFILVNPGGGWKSKCWAPESYAELIRRLETDLPWSIVVTGSPNEEDLIRTVLERAGAQRVTYIPSTLVQLIALERRAKLFVGGDTGPLHLAAAVGAPIVAVYNAAETRNTPERNGPFSPADIVVSARGPVQHRGGRTATYLQGVSVPAVLAAVRQRLAKAYG